MAVDALIGSLVEPFEFILLGLYLGINNYRTLLTGCKLVLFALGRRRKKKEKGSCFLPLLSYFAYILHFPIISPLYNLILFQNHQPSLKQAL